MRTPIVDFVRAYAEKNALRLHMPGHKGKGALGIEALDLTEIEGADSLYEAEGIIKESEDNASKLFGCKTYYSTEGSSLCIRAMLYLLTLYAREKGVRAHVLAGRNAHKTFLSACIARQVADRGFSVVYETAIQVFEDFERVKFGGGSEEDRSSVKKYFDCDLLIIDDLGSEMTTQFTVSALYRIVNSRLMENRSTIISTNLDTNSFEQWYNAQITSRVLGNYKVMIFKGNDLRRKQGGFR